MLSSRQKFIENAGERISVANDFSTSMSANAGYVDVHILRLSVCTIPSYSDLFLKCHSVFNDTYFLSLRECITNVVEPANYDKERRVGDWTEQ